jgi:hypothetical protein
MKALGIQFISMAYQYPLGAPEMQSLPRAKLEHRH